MCDKRNKNDLGLANFGHDRRKLLKTEAVLAAAPLLAGFASNVLAAAKIVVHGVRLRKGLLELSDLEAPFKKMTR